MRKTKELETVDTVERERERESLFIQHGIRLLDHTHTNILVNNKIGYKIKENSITILVSKLDTS